MHARNAKSHGVSMVAVALTAVGCMGSPGAPSEGFGFGPGFPDGGLPSFRSPDGGPGNHPNLGTTVTAATTLPPISGGTLLIARDGHTAVAADPDRDRVYVVDVDNQSMRAEIALTPGDEPGRLVQDAAGRVHVALRRGGALVTIDLGSLAVTARRAVCSAPRGVAYDPAADTVLVACAGGELVTLPAAGGAATRTVLLDPDLRDVAVTSEGVMVSRFRSAEVLQIDASGAVMQRMSPPAVFGIDHTSGTTTAEPDVAWRMLALPVPAAGGGRPGVASGGTVVLHQRAHITDVAVTPGGYGAVGGCNTGIVESTITTMRPGVVATRSPLLSGLSLAVDIAVSPDGSRYAVAAPGNARNPGLAQVQVYDASHFGSDAPVGSCASADGTGQGRIQTTPLAGQVTALAFTQDGRLVAQVRDPAMLQVLDTGLSIPLSLVPRQDTGHTVFHSNAGQGIACASCHPEGGDDGRVWQFRGIGPRRTPSVRGGMLGTEPFHWNGDIHDMSHLVTEVFVSRMGGQPLDTSETAALGNWVNSIPLLPPIGRADAASVARGHSLFQDSTVGCAGCHSGAKFTNNATVDVGTGGAFQVPPLMGVGWRGPYLHDGRASSLRARFLMGGDTHGHTSTLTDDQVSDLVAYLESL